MTQEEREHFEAFRRGERRDPTTIPNLAGWYETVSGRPPSTRMERVRIHQDPPTAYQEWVRWIGQWNERAGEVMHYTTPQRSADVGLDAAGPDDWWLLDDAELIRMHFAEPDVAALHLIDDPDAIADAKRWWQLALRASA